MFNTNPLITKISFKSDNKEGSLNGKVTVVDKKPEIKDGDKKLNAYMNQTAINNLVTAKINRKETKKNRNGEYKNDLKSMFNNNEAVIMGIIMRSFGAKDVEGNMLLRGNDERGNFTNAVNRLDELKNLGINTLHILPLHPAGKKNAMGTAGSMYSPGDFLKIDPELADPKINKTPEEQFKDFVKECHKRGFRVMLDLPSCASFDLFNREPEMMAFEAKTGLPKTPGGWQDIRMLQPFKNKDTRELNPKVYDLHEKYIDMCLDWGVDGIRADVARAKPPEFWDKLIKYSHSKDPEFAWLAETYTYEDASPQQNMDYDRPEECLNAGFDSYYGQYHIFHEWSNANELLDYVKENLDMTKRLPGKSLIGSFGTHDDKSLMCRGGVNFMNLVSGLQATLPMTNPYYMDGYQSGDDYMYDFEGGYDPETITETTECTVHKGMPDIFNFSRPLIGKHPEIGEFMAQMNKVRSEYKDVITKGSFIPLPVKNNPNDQIIAFARHYNGKTLVIIANRNVNGREKASIYIPGLKPDTKLQDLALKYGEESKFAVRKGKLDIDTGTGRFHIFEVDIPNIENSGLKVFRQQRTK